MKDYYAILGVQPWASLTEIRKAFRKSAKVYHPDLHPGDTPDEGRKRQLQFIRLTRAYEVLSNSERRREFDQKRARSIRRFNTPKNQNRRSSTSYSSRETPNANESRKQCYENIPEPEEALNDLLNEVEGLLRQFGLNFRDPLEMLVTWAKRVFLETANLWDDANESAQSNRNSSKNTSGATCSGTSKEWIDGIEEELRRMKNASKIVNSDTFSKGEKKPSIPDDTEIAKELKRLKQKYQNI